MRFGVHIPHVGHLASRENIATFVRRAEELGFHSLWVSDHIVIPQGMETRYPGRASGRFPVTPDMPFLEPLITLAYAASLTQRMLLGTSVLILPMRHPIIVAKELATLDVLSGGRLIFGVGVGWLKEEFDALGASFAGRGPRTDEYLEAIISLWTQDDPSFEGSHVRVQGIGFAPKPLQKPRPPIWVGGVSPGALKRAGRYGDAWHATGLISPQELSGKFQEVQNYARKAGRDPSAIALSVRLDGVGRQDPQQVIPYLQELKAIGVSHALVAFPARTLEASLELMERFASQVIPPLS